MRRVGAKAEGVGCAGAGRLPHVMLGVPTDVNLGGEGALGDEDPVGGYSWFRKVVVDDLARNLGQRGRREGRGRVIAVSVG